MTSKQKELLTFSEKIQKGAQKAVRKLVEARAANNKTLVIGDKEGNASTVAARDLLSSMK
ncbi:hypothetical protein HGH92_17140 [Chitinophaga varians]|uniref:Uncharacterized protein n=1 Tax=Chitinophaga varians TaxID=2202339 RepID=A0A847RY80_9BACT|nr:hypothetical protein [Chitinophaga varians]NLR66035.1 hypothetical protein [Chitinophaga varians]